MAKSTDAEIEKRVTEVYVLLLEGASRTEIQQYAAKIWGVETRTIDTYIERAKVLIKEHATSKRDDVQALAHARLNLLWRHSSTIGNDHAALAVLKELNTLDNLYAPPTFGFDEDELETISFVVESLKKRGKDVNAALRLLVTIVEGGLADQPEEE